ncbi:MAG: phosphoribosyltransferase [Acidobacteriia bacterium]|nr:phosphoribosyltransferase [Terriglobia bacterium]
MIQLPFADRAEAGRLLAAELAMLKLPASVIVLALPRGGLPVGLEVAKKLQAPLDVVIVRKLGVPWQPELAMGAIASGSVEILDQDLIRALGISRHEIDAVIAKERAEVERRERLYRKGRPALDLRGKTVLLVDDGLATGSTMLVAARYVRSLKPARMLIVVPVGSVQACERLKTEADDCICLATPEPFVAVGDWYADFPQVNDSEVQRFLEAGRLSGKGNRSELLTRPTAL